MKGKSLNVPPIPTIRQLVLSNSLKKRHLLSNNVIEREHLIDSVVFYHQLFIKSVTKINKFFTEVIRTTINDNNIYLPPGSIRFSGILRDRLTTLS